jgi:hypothetical protein
VPLLALLSKMPAKQFERFHLVLDFSAASTAWIYSLFCAMSIGTVPFVELRRNRFPHFAQPESDPFVAAALELICEQKTFPPIYYGFLNSRNLCRFLLSASAHVVGWRDLARPFLKTSAVDRDQSHFEFLASQLLADVALRDKRGRTPLHHLVRCGYKEGIALLLGEGADPTAVDSVSAAPSFIVGFSLMLQDGNTPLHLACGVPTNLVVVVQPNGDEIADFLHSEDDLDSTDFKHLRYCSVRGTALNHEEDIEALRLHPAMVSYRAEAVAVVKELMELSRMRRRYGD